MYGQILYPTKIKKCQSMEAVKQQLEIFVFGHKNIQNCTHSQKNVDKKKAVMGWNNFWILSNKVYGAQIVKKTKKKALNSLYLL